MCDTCTEHFGEISQPGNIKPRTLPIKNEAGLSGSVGPDGKVEKHIHNQIISTSLEADTKSADEG